MHSCQSTLTFYISDIRSSSGAWENLPEITFSFTMQNIESFQLPIIKLILAFVRTHHRLQFAIANHISSIQLISLISFVLLELLIT